MNGPVHQPGAFNIECLDIRGRWHGGMNRGNAEDAIRVAQVLHAENGRRCRVFNPDGVQVFATDDRPQVDVQTVLELCASDLAIAQEAFNRGDTMHGLDKSAIRLSEVRAAVAELIETTVALVSAGKRFRNTVVETRGVQGMDDHDAALRAAETALARAGGAA